MRPNIKTISILFFLINSILSAQYFDNSFGLSAGVNYTTTARIYLNPDAIERIVREEHINVEDIYSGSVELRYRVSQSVIAGIGTEYIRKVSTQKNIIGLPPQFAGIEIEEGFSMIPVEFSVYYFLPFSTESLKFTMGGGFGIYFGNHIRNIEGVGVENVSRDFAWGIHGRTGMDYMITHCFSLRFEMRFRDPEFEMRSKYEKDSFQYGNREIKLPEEPFPSMINIDGMTFTLGVVLHF